MTVLGTIEMSPGAEALNLPVSLLIGMGVFFGMLPVWGGVLKVNSPDAAPDSAIVPLVVQDSTGSGDLLGMSLRSTVTVTSSPVVTVAGAVTVTVAG